MVKRHEESHELPAVPDSIARSRAIVLGVGSGLPQRVRDDAALLVSELMSNTVRHGGAAARLTVAVDDCLLTVSVHDDGAELPVMGQELPDPSITSGRGLRIIERVAQRWGTDVDADGRGKTVWFELATAVPVVAEGADEGKNHEEREDRSVWS